MLIPKTIHYCWFGDNDIPELAKRCIDSWKKYCPDYEIILWNESNYDINKIPYIKDAYEQRKWAFVTDFARLDIVYKYGGFYLDTDVELIRSLEDMRQYECFMALERDCNIATGLGFGALPRNGTIKALIDIYLELSFFNPDGSLNLTPCTKYTTKWFEERGYEKKDYWQNVDGVDLLSSDFFCPRDYKTGKMYLTANSHGIHWYHASWMPIHDQRIHQNELILIDRLPIFLAKPVCNVYRNGYRLIQYTLEGNIKQKLKQKFCQGRGRKWI